MQPISSYCTAATNGTLADGHRLYHDTEYGFPIDSDNELFGRLLLEINQAGLSWNTIIQKRATIRSAYANFDLAVVARFGGDDVARLLNDPGVIRNRLKVQAAIFNANRILELQAEFGSFRKWLDHHHPLTRDQWVKLFKKTFRFTGGEITNEFLLSSGYLKGAHEETCPIYAETLKHRPRWADPD